MVTYKISRKLKILIRFCLGWYWIDPNIGMPDDAIYVYCNMTGGGETCVFPDIHSSQMPNIPWRKEGNRNNWYSNLRGGFKVSWIFGHSTNCFIMVNFTDYL